MIKGYLSNLVYFILQSWVGKVPEYPHPVASSISSRILVELGMVTAIMAAAAAVVGGFLAGAVLAAAKFVFNTTVYFVWPIVLPLLKLSLGIIYGILETIWNRFADGFYEGGIFYRLKSFYTMAGFAASLEVLKPVGALVLLMVLIIRFTMSSKPRNFRKWVIHSFFSIYFINLSSLSFNFFFFFF